MTDTVMPPLIQAIGLACVPVPGMPADDPALARQPVAAAIVTLARREDGHREFVVARHSDARAAELPLPWLVDRSLVPGAPVVATPADVATLALDAASRRFAAEPRLAVLTAGKDLIDPCSIVGTPAADEPALLRRFGIPLVMAGDAEVERAWSRHQPDRAMDAALGDALARLVAWAHGAAFAAATPEPLFETLLPLHGWLVDEVERVPGLDPLLRSRPLRHAASFASHYRVYCERREAGDADAAWVTFEEGLFHT